MRRDFFSVLLICSGCEPGRDGVGDYSRRLAGEAIRQGHRVCLVAWFDGFLGQPEWRGVQMDGVTPVPSLRLAPALSVKERIDRVREWMGPEGVDWVSLQYVPYGFDAKGLPSSLGSSLQRLEPRLGFHIMFHETWLRMDDLTKLWRLPVALGQRWLVHHLNHQLSPAAIHTSNAWYERQLQSLGLRARLLSLPGNVGLVNEPQDSLWLNAQLTQRIVGGHLSRAEKPFLIGVFGKIPADWQPESAASVIASLSMSFHRRVVVVSIGGLGSGAFVWQLFGQTLLGKADFLTVGWCESADVSRWMTHWDAALVVTPHHLIGKSGAAAAAIEHGVPLLLANIRKPEAPLELSPLHMGHPVVSVLETDAADRLLKMHRVSPRERLPEITSQWLVSLGELETPQA